MESDMVAGNFTRPEQKVLKGTQAEVPPSLPVNEPVESSTEDKKDVEDRTPTPQGPTEEDLRVLEEITKAANN